MAKNKVLVTGVSGLVGSYLIPKLMEEFEELYFVEHETMVGFGKKITIDLTDMRAVLGMLEEVQPNIIINLAAFTDVEGCETKTNYAELINYRLVEALAYHIQRIQGRVNNKSYILHISTDYIFDGDDGNYREGDKPNPINQYGRTKLLGEHAITSLVSHNDWCIARLSTPFGFHPKKKTFPLFIIEKLRNGEKINAIVDQYTSPTYTDNLAEMLIEIIKKRATGIFHVSGASRLSRYEQALRIAKILNLDSDLIKGIQSSCMKWIAKRPKDSSLCVNRAQRELSHGPEQFDVSLARFASELQS